MISGEESTEDLEIRQHDINEHYRLNSHDLDGHLELISRRGHDMTCFVISPRSGLVETTDEWKLLREIILDMKSGLTVIDHWGLIVSGTEGDRHATGNIMSILGGLTEEAGGAIIINQHPSRREEAIYSGNSGFEGGVRSLWHIKSVAGDDTKKKRSFSVSKANYSPEHEIALEWRAGLFVPVNEKILSPVELMEVRARRNQAKEAFLNALEALTKQQRAVSDKKRAQTYAPRMMVGKFTEQELEKAMGELFAEGVIKANVDLPWRGEDRHRAVGIAIVAGRSDDAN